MEFLFQMNAFILESKKGLLVFVASWISKRPMIEWTRNFCSMFNLEWVFGLSGEIGLKLV